MEGIELFTKQECVFDSLDSLVQSAPYKYIKQVYGNMLFDPQARSGFLKASKMPSGKILVSESCYHDYEYDYQTIGYFVPVINSHASRFAVPRCQTSRVLSKFGTVTTHLNIPSHIKDIVTQARYEDVTAEGDMDKISSVVDTGLSAHVDRGDKVSESYYNLVPDDEGDYVISKGYPIPRKVYDFIKASRYVPEEMLSHNPWVKSLDAEHMAVQKWKTGNSMLRHTDVAIVGYDRYLITCIYYLTTGAFIGRELVVGRRTEQDLVKHIEFVLQNNNQNVGYGTLLEDFEDTMTIKPEDQKGIIINCFNPMFYHGVSEMKIGADVCTMISMLNLT